MQNRRGSLTVILSFLAAAALVAAYYGLFYDARFGHNAFASLLRRSGFRVAEIGLMERHEVLAGERRYILLEGGELFNTYQYGSNAETEKESRYIDRGGCSFTSPDSAMKVTWVSEPHFFKKGRIIVCYVGTNEKILRLLNKAFGPEFAGAG